MKEATGELNATVIIVMIVATSVAFFYTIIWPSIKNNTNQTIACNKAICDSKPNADGMTVDCWLPGEEAEKFTCIWKG